MDSKTLDSYMDLEYLTDAEKKEIEKVLNRNKKLSQKENDRLRRLSTNSAASDRIFNQNKNSQSMQDDLHKNSSSSALDVNIIGNCSSCKCKFSLLPWSCTSPNTNLCAVCKSKMCKRCSYHLERPNIQICKLCHQNVLFEAKSGKWFFNNREIKGSNQDMSDYGLNRQKWLSLEKLNNHNKDFESSDNLESPIASKVPVFCKSFIKRKVNYPGFSQVENRNSTKSPDTSDIFMSPFRRVTKQNKGNFLNVNLDNTVKSEDSGCALDMDEESLSDKALKVPTTAALSSNSKCYFRPLQNITQNNLIFEQNQNETQRFSAISQSGRLDTTMNDSITSLFSQTSSAGEIMLSSNFNERETILNLVVHKCRNLINADAITNSINPYIIIYMRSNRQKYPKLKTKVIFNNNNPVYDQCYSMMFNHYVESLCLLLCHKNDKTGKDLAVGQVGLLPEEITKLQIIQKWFTFMKMSSMKNLGSESGSRTHNQNDYKPSNISMSSPLSDQLSSSSSNEWKNLGFKPTGELTLALKFVANHHTDNFGRLSGELNVWIKSCRVFDDSSDDAKYPSDFNTSPIQTKPKQRNRNGSWINDVLGYQELMAKAHLFTTHGVLSKEILSTKYLEAKLSYIWSSIIKFDIDIPDLAHSELEISIWMNNSSLLSKILSPRNIGTVTLGKGNDNQKLVKDKYFHRNTSTSDARLWQTMLTTHNIWIDEILVLRRRKEKS